MGYTHYFSITKEVGSKDWLKFRAAVQALYLCNWKDLLAFEIDSDKPPVFNDDLIRFNGSTNKTGHETFLLENRVSNEFCKTAHKKYDLPVTCALILAKYFFSDCITVTSDGANKLDGKTHLDPEWSQAVDFLNINGYRLQVFLDDDEGILLRKIIVNS